MQTEEEKAARKKAKKAKQQKQKASKQEHLQRRRLADRAEQSSGIDSQNAIEQKGGRGREVQRPDGSWGTAANAQPLAYNRMTGQGPPPHAQPEYIPTGEGMDGVKLESCAPVKQEYVPSPDLSGFVWNLARDFPDPSAHDQTLAPIKYESQIPPPLMAHYQMPSAKQSLAYRFKTTVQPETAQAADAWLCNTFGSAPAPGQRVGYIGAASGFAGSPVTSTVHIAKQQDSMAQTEPGIRYEASTRPMYQGLGSSEFAQEPGTGYKSQTQSVSLGKENATGKSESEDTSSGFGGGYEQLAKRQKTRWDSELEAASMLPEAPDHHGRL